MNIKKIAIASTVVLSALVLTSCASPVVNDADVVNENIATAADNFEINRRILIINNESDAIIQSIEGWCNAEIDPWTIRTTCKVPGGYHRHINGRNEHTTFSIQQLDTANVSKNFYRVVIKPSAIIPAVEIR